MGCGQWLGLSDLVCYCYLMSFNFQINGGYGLDGGLENWLLRGMGWLL